MPKRNIANVSNILVGLAQGWASGEDEWGKTLDAAGQTYKYLKTTYDPAGKIVSIKDKMGAGTIFKP